MKVFVSSTVYDLLDIRGEIEQLLRELGVTPVMSDEKLSGFDHTFDKNSIETCLLNVESSDAVIIILDQRYGPTLGSCGFEDVSATHLEYHRAKELGKPIYFYVRDRLEADFNIHKKNKSTDDLRLSWIKPGDNGLFDLLEEHRKLEAKRDESNWVTLFTNSIDLKESIRKHFEPVIKPQVLMKAIQDNRFPLFTCRCDVDFLTKNGPQFQCHVVLKNISLASAFDFSAQWMNESHNAELTDIVGPGQEVTSRILINHMNESGFNSKLMIKFRSSMGIAVKEQYRFKCYTKDEVPKIFYSGVNLLERTYHNAPLPSLVIEDM